MEIKINFQNLLFIIKRNYSFHLIKYLVLISLLIVSKTSYSQINNIRFEQITINEGLSQGSVRSILRDSYGYIWFCTQDGLNRYDGYSFKIFRNEIDNPYSISSNDITAIDEDKNGDLWVGTSNGLNKFSRDKYKFRLYNSQSQKSNRLYSNTIFTVLASKINNTIWFSNREGLFELNINSGKLERFQHPDLNLFEGNINQILEYDKNTLLIGVYNGSLYRFDLISKSFKKIIYRSSKQVTEFKNLRSIVKDTNGNIWIGTYNGLYKYNLELNKYWEYFSLPANDNSMLGNIITDLAIDKENNLWISVLSKGLSKFIINKNRFINYTKDNSDYQPTSLINIMFIDQSGILWLGTNGFGVFKLNPYLNNFSLFSQSEKGLSIKSIRTFYEDSNKNLWIGGYGGVNKLNLSSGAFEYFVSTNKFKHGLSSTAVYVFGKDRDNPDKFLWIGTEGNGLMKLDLQSGYSDNYPFNDLWRKKNLGRSVYSILDDGDGNLWVGTSQGLYIINKKDFSHRHFGNNPADPNSISPQSVNQIYKDRQGNIWVGTDIGGLCLVDKINFTFKHFNYDLQNPNSLSNNFVKCIYQDSKNRLWVGTNGGGLNLLTDRDKGVFQRITTENGLPNNVIYGILEDSKGNLWMSSNKGICKYNPEKKSFTNFNVMDGLQSNEFNTNAYFQNKNGRIYFGGINGFNYFNPDNFYMNNNLPVVVLTGFELFNKPLNIDQKINDKVILKNSFEFTKQVELDYDQNVFSIEFAALDFASPFKNKYSYILEGFDKNWTFTGYNRKVTYTNLQPGKYIFKVRGSNNDGLWSKKSAQLIIIVIPPFWQTWWFILLLVLFLLGMLAYIYYQRINTIKQQKYLLEKEVCTRTAELAELNKTLIKSEDELKELNVSKDKYFSILAHDLRGPFGAVLGLSDILIEDLDILDKKEIENLVLDISQLLHEQFILLENLLGWSRIQLNKYYYEPESVNFSEIAFRVHRFLFNNAKLKKINLTIDAENGIYVTGNSTMILSVIQNLVQNAIKFTEENGTINISASKKNGFAVLSVKDNGIGMDDKTVANLFKAGLLKSTDGTANEKGSGIGLMLIKEFIYKMNGEIKAESKLKNGSTFTVSIPLSDEE